MSLEINAEFGTEEWREEFDRKVAASDHTFFFETVFAEVLGADPQWLGVGCPSLATFLVDTDDGLRAVELRNVNATSDEVNGGGVPDYTPTPQSDTVGVPEDAVDSADEALEMIADGMEMVVRVYTVDPADEPCCGSCPDDADVYHRGEVVEERTISDIQASAEFLAENGEQVNHGHTHAYNTLP